MKNKKHFTTTYIPNLPTLKAYRPTSSTMLIHNYFFFFVYF
nr:MAG TPA: hypothetical protein [Inoviridae sp.]DAT31072.1 MAG TPA: hypothetical protein [Inoviridae sp.]